MSPQIAIFMHLALQTKRLAHPSPKINALCRHSEHTTLNYMPWATLMPNIVERYCTDFTLKPAKLAMWPQIALFMLLACQTK